MDEVRTASRSDRSRHCRLPAWLVAAGASVGEFVVAWCCMCRRVCDINRRPAPERVHTRCGRQQILLCDCIGCMQYSSLLPLRRRDPMRLFQSTTVVCECRWNYSSKSSSLHVVFPDKVPHQPAKNPTPASPRQGKVVAQHQQDKHTPSPLLYHTIPRPVNRPHTRLTRTRHHVSQRPGSPQRRPLQARLPEV
jgi:hypothetical protein